MKTTIITGASSGIGEAFARRLAAQGENVLLVARSAEKLARLCDELVSASNINAQYVALDLTESDAAKKLFAETERRELQVETLINNAGFGSMGDFTASETERDMKMIDLNIKATVALTH
ncbi:MAG TPA: SDR family NAD(P)-dependent oxidoreductase, partial [Ktedonobacteraceae bacterium]|nr:SDR family NAD(P)-dependent oxidoreductase [Ktedonobacteraceae bacterium]